MKVSSLPGAATATRNAKLQMLTPVSAGATVPAAGSAVTRPAAMAPPPRASSFGGADPRAMFEALVQQVDRDDDGKLSLGEVNALNQGGLLARSFARIDGNGDGTLTADEVAARAPWAGGMLPSGGQGGGERGADMRPVIDRLTDKRDAALTTEGLAATRPADFAAGSAPVAAAPGSGTTLPTDLDPASMIEAMVMARVTAAAEDVTARADAAQQAYKLR